jgi:hypothetical protein
MYSCNADKGNKTETLNVEQKTTSQKTTSQKTTSKGKLLFFLNPGGYPCQVQDGILNSLEEEISSKVSIKRIKTTDPDDRPYFYEYGIRALPLLILINSNGKVIKRFAPGIKDKNSILDSISTCDCS